jgi:cytosine/adenosine deaminase-related metal-dependent hydrolase
MDVTVRGGLIDEIVSTGAPHDELQVVDCHGRVITPAFANIHNHFYSAFLRGDRVPQPPPRDQRERLERLVWPYEPTLSLDEVRLAVRIGLLDAVQAGTTAIVDHHASAAASMAFSTSLPKRSRQLGCAPSSATSSRTGTARRWRAGS